ncbi:MAG: neutral/alkaline non-lysosomal ceramidase N-terminal domain-containing protein [Planctomycetaceae bacterium]
MTRCCPFVAFAVMMALFCPGFQPVADAGGPEWKAGFARREVTPQRPVFLAGYSARDRPFDEVASPLFVKALALEDAEGRRAVLATCDVLGYKRMIAEPICERIQAASDLERKDVLLNASHTHTGPALLLDAEERNDSITPAQAEEQIAWTQRLMDLTVEAALEALEKLEPARLSHGVGFAPFVMNRREWTPRGVVLGVNPSGYADRSVPVLRIDAPDGTLRGVLYGAAVHNTTLTQNDYMVSGDYAGYSQAYIEKQHPGVQAMFMAGCGGSANPHPRGTLEDAQQHGETLGMEVCRVLEGELAPVAGPLETRFESVTLPLKDPPTREEIDRALTSRRGWQSRTARAMLRVLESGEPLPESFDYPLSVWQFGDDLTLVGLSGEVVGEYVPLIQAAAGRGRLWIAAYCHDVFGYVPTAQVLTEGGYEARGLYSGSVGLFSPEVESQLVEKVRTMTQAAGRDPH